MSTVDVKKKISLSLENQSIDEALSQILKETRYSYKITGYHIIITPSDNEQQKSTKEKTERPTQTVRGIVLDSKTNAPIEFATVRIMNSGSLGSTTDSLGRFRIDHVPVGRCNIQTSYVGYNANIFNEIPVTSSKEVYMEIPLDENVHSLAEVVIQPEIKKDKPLNAMAIADALTEVMGSQIDNIYYKSETTLPFKADLYPENGFLKGGSTDNVAMEYGLKFHIDWLKGQKTGFFVDQRENRSLLERYAKGRSVLNMFCYTGGFSVYAMRGDAKLVHSVDSSAKAIDLTNKNIELNFPGDTRHAAYAEDAFKYLDRMGDQYDLIVLDPPAFAKHRDALRNALQGYRKLNVKAFEKIKPGGILFTFSCSQAVSKENFRTAVFTAAAMSGRSVRILHQLTQPADHPVSIYHPEGEYLKGLVLYVE